MKTASPALIAYLNSGQEFIMTELYTITLIGGTVMRYCDADIDITYGANTYSSFRIGRTNTKISVGVEVNSITVTVFADSNDLINGIAWLPAAKDGALDGATILVERLFMPTWGDQSLGTIHMFGGNVSNIKVGRTSAVMDVKSDLEKLNVMLPRNMFQSTCVNTLFDNACSLLKSNFTTGNITVLAGSTTAILVTGRSEAADYFSLGTITFVTGANAGVSRSVRAFAGGYFTLALPLVATPSPGDFFVATPGCDKLKATCASTKFNNVINFKATPYIPDPETMA
jgi:uncharacterized phage protein (TIGR02218 family)